MSNTLSPALTNINQISNQSFYFYWKENMQRLGLPTPASSFLGTTMLITTFRQLADLVTTYGTKVSLKELLLTSPSTINQITGASVFIKELLLVAGSMSAAFYIGAAIGSLIIALEKCLSHKAGYKSYLSSNRATFQEKLNELWSYDSNAFSLRSTPNWLASSYSSNGQFLKSNFEGHQNNSYIC